MGEIEGWGQSSGLVPNGLLPNQAAFVNRDLDSERWSKAEERISELIACIQPNQPSEDRRNDVANYVQRLIMKCFPCQVFTFGSVPLKTYLPDGDIDLTAFSSNEIMKDTWANHVRDTLLNEEKDENAEFSVKEVQYIQAEVKLIKCLVENIVVDISFNQLSGLCTLCFLEEVDHLINHNHLFKRSVILIKAWCYYESRVLGAHHGLISTYALETLVLYIFHVFNNSFTGPLEVLYRFLEFFSKFDWDNFCVSLWGPVPISSLPDVKELLLSKLFIDACSSVYAVSPGSLDNQGQPSVSKHFNVIDPLRINNNLGRSVSKGNFYRIRSAFSFGAKRLASLLECPKEELYYEVNQFFMNTWDRYGSGNRPDAPENSLSCLTLSTKPSQLRKPENLEKKEKNKVTKENTSGREIETSRISHSACPPQLARHPLERTSRSNEISTFSSNQKRHATNSRISNHIGTEVGGDQCAPVDKEQKSCKLDHLANDVQGMHLLARTRSSPELTDTYSDTSSKGRRSRGPETRNSRIFAAGLDAIRKNMGSHNFPSKITKSTATKQITSSKKHDDESNNGLKNRYMENSGSVAVGEEAVSAMGTKGMLQEEQDIVNMTSSSIAPDLNGNVHMPMNLASTHTPLSISHLGSMEISNVSSSTRSDTSLEPSDECKSDILHSDFTSHWQNLQYGRFCHNPQYHGPLVYPPPVVVQPMYLQGRAPWDGPGRPLSSNMNSMTQVISYGPRVVLVAADPTPSVSSSSSGVYQRYPDEMPRHRSGTGTYLPNPKVSTRDRHASGSRRGHFSYEKSSHNGERSDRDGNWNTNSKTRTAGRNHSRSQAERSSARIERSAARDSQADRPWSTYRPESFHSYQSQNEPMRSNSSAIGGPANVVYGMYPLQTVNASRDSSNGPTVMAMYPYYHDSSESSDITRDGGRSSETYDEQRFHNSSNRRSSPD